MMVKRSIAIVVTSTIVMLTAGCTDGKDVFAAWKKINPSIADSLTYDEWRLLRDERLLPGQNDTRKAEMLAGAAVGMAAANSATRR